MATKVGWLRYWAIIDGVSKLIQDTNTQMDYYNLFFGAVLIVTLQLLPVTIINLSQSNVSNKLFGTFLLLFILSSIRNTLINPFEGAILHDFLKNIHFGAYYDALLYLYLLAAQKELKPKEVHLHLIIPHLLFVSTLINLAIPLGTGYLRVLDYAFFTITLSYALAGIYRLTGKYWSGTLHKVRVRVTAFYSMLILYFLYTAFRLIFQSQSALVYYIDTIYYLTIFTLLPVYGYTKISRLKDYVLPVLQQVGTSVDIEQLSSEINRYTEQHYRSKNFTLDFLAKKIGIDKQKLSVAFRNEFGMDFKKHLHLKRIECFKKEARDPENHNLDINGIAQKCGFSSRASFYRIYKMYEDDAPTDHLKMGQ